MAELLVAAIAWLLANPQALAALVALAFQVWSVWSKLKGQKSKEQAAREAYREAGLDRRGLDMAMRTIEELKREGIEGAGRVDAVLHAKTLGLREREAIEAARERAWSSRDTTAPDPAALEEFVRRLAPKPGLARLLNPLSS